MQVSPIHALSTGLSLIRTPAVPLARRRGVLSAAILAVGLALVPTTVAQPSFQGLGDLPGGLGSHVGGVSADGAVVVGFSYYTAPGGLLQSHAITWTQAAGMNALFAGGLDYTSSALCISADGLTIGGWHALTIIEERAFVWSAAGGELQLDTRSGVEALSATGQVAAGYLAHGSGSVGRAAIWDANGHGTFIDLQGMENFASRARGISADGSIVVGWAPFNGTMVRAFRWTAATGMVNIGSPDPQGPTSDAYAISPDGSVIVGLVGPALGGMGPTQPARWTAAGGWQLLGNLPGATGGAAYAVSADGNTVVGASNGHAFIWRPTRGMEDLQVVLAPPAGWTLAEARDISADGRIIVGNGTRVGGGGAWIATLPRYGDLNCDGVVNFGDINPFVLALSDPAGYANQFPNCNIMDGDVNGDGHVDFGDINPFVALLSGE